LFSLPEQHFLQSFCEAEARVGSGQPFLTDNILCCDMPQLTSHPVLCAGFSSESKYSIS
jgi:hypothetical protein